MENKHSSTVVPLGASGVKHSEWILTRASQCSEAFTPGYHVLPSALFGAQPSTHRHQLAPEVPLNAFPLPCAASSSPSNLNDFFFLPPAAPCIRSGAPSAGQMGVCLKPTKMTFPKHLLIKGIVSDIIINDDDIQCDSNNKHYACVNAMQWFWLPRHIKANVQGAIDAQLSTGFQGSFEDTIITFSLFLLLY